MILLQLGSSGSRIKSVGPVCDAHRFSVVADEVGVVVVSGVVDENM